MIPIRENSVYYFNFFELFYIFAFNFLCAVFIGEGTGTLLNLQVRVVWDLYIGEGTGGPLFNVQIRPCAKRAHHTVLVTPRPQRFACTGQGALTCTSFIRQPRNPV